MTKPTHRYLHVPTQKGVTERVPVSDYVLNLGKFEKTSIKVAVSAKRNWRPMFALQSASFALTLMLCASSFGITYGNPVGTLSYFRDDEASPDNSFAAGLLAFRVNPGDVSIPIKEGDVIKLSPLFEPKPDSFDIKYRVHTEVVGEDSPLCTLLQASGSENPYIYSGAFRDLRTEPATTTGRSNLEVSLPNGAGIANGISCTIALIFRGWYVFAPENTGYTDEHRDTFTFIYDAPEQDLPPALIESAAPESSSTPELLTDSTSTPPVDETASSTQEKISKALPVVVPLTDNASTTDDTSTPPTETASSTENVGEPTSETPPPPSEAPQPEEASAS